jgi:DNA-binding transcriptional MerR regulator
MTLHAVTTDTPDPDEPVTAMALCAEAGISRGVADMWATAGLIEPCDRHGYYRKYPASEVNIARLMKRLIDAGMDVRHAHTAARNLDAGSVDLGPGLRLEVTE